MSDERSEDERNAVTMLDQLEPFSPTPAIWKAFQDYHNEISAKHGTHYSNMDVKVAKTDEVPFATQVVVICFGLKKDSSDPNEQYLLEYAIMPLDDNGHAFAFLPVRASTNKEKNNA